MSKFVVFPASPPTRWGLPTPYPEEFRRDVIAVARQGDQTIPQVAKSFGISESCLHRWLRIAEKEERAGQDPPTGGVRAK